MEENNNIHKKEGNIRKILYNEVSFVVAMIALISGVIFWVVNPQNNLQLEIVKLQSQVESAETVTTALNKIKNNDLHELQLRMDQIEGRQIQILQEIASIKTLIKNTH